LDIETGLLQLGVGLFSTVNSQKYYKYAATDATNVCIMPFLLEVGLTP